MRKKNRGGFFTKSPKRNRHGIYKIRYGFDYGARTGSGLKKAAEKVKDMFSSSVYNKDTRRMAKNVMKYDGDFNRFNTYVQDVGPFQIKKKVGTRKERLADATKLVREAKKDKRAGDSTMYDLYASYGQKGTKPKTEIQNTEENVVATNNKKPPKTKSSSPSKNTSVGLSNLGVSVSYFKRGGKIKKGNSFDQYD